MFHLKCLLFINLLLQVMCKLSSTQQPEEPYVYSFVKAQPHDVVGYAQLRFNSKENMLEPWKMFCSGAFFSKKAVVAPAECAYKFETQELISPGDMFIVRGSRNKMIEETDLESSYKFKHNIERIVVHPDYVYGKYSKSNIGVWILTKEINNEEFGQIHLHLPRSPITKQAFGKLLAFMQPDMPEKNRLVVWKSDLIIYPNSDCNKLVTTDVGLICAGKSHKVEESSSIDVKDKFEYVRANDIGGILVIEENLVGIYIRGVYKIVNSKRIFYPALYTDLYAFRYWLLKHDGFVNHTIKRHTSKLNKTMVATLAPHVVKRDDAAKPTTITNEANVADVPSEKKSIVIRIATKSRILRQDPETTAQPATTDPSAGTDPSGGTNPTATGGGADTTTASGTNTDTTAGNTTSTAGGNDTTTAAGDNSTTAGTNTTTAAGTNTTTPGGADTTTDAGTNTSTTAAGTNTGNTTTSENESSMATSSTPSSGISPGKPPSDECVDLGFIDEESASTVSKQSNIIFLILLSSSFWRIFYILRDIFT